MMKDKLVQDWDWLWASLPHGEVAEILILNVANDPLWVTGASDKDNQTVDGPANFCQLCHLDVMSGPENFLIENLQQDWYQ